MNASKDISLTALMEKHLADLAPGYPQTTLGARLDTIRRSMRGDLAYTEWDFNGEMTANSHICHREPQRVCIWKAWIAAIDEAYRLAESRLKANSIKPITKEYLAESIHMIPESGCWIWMKNLDKDGYGQYRGRFLAHRVVFELLRERIPLGLQLDHLCRVKCCVNPSHLEPVTCKENIRRAHLYSGGPIAARRLAARTHCKYGHPFSGDNLIVRSDGSGYRGCKACLLALRAKHSQTKRPRI